MKRLLLALSLFSALPLLATDRHVAPSGSGPIPCTHASPCSLDTATQTAGLVGGDRILLHPGDYGVMCVQNVNGSAGNPITIMPEDKSQRTRLRGNNFVNTCGSGIIGFASTSSYIRVRDLEAHVTDTGNPIRVSTTNGISPTTFKGNCSEPRAIGVELINNILHDCTNGISGGDGPLLGKKLVYGNVFYSIGFASPDAGHGHALYIQNCDGSSEANCRSTYQDNTLYASMSYDTQIYGTGASVYIWYTTLDHNVHGPTGGGTTGSVWGLNFTNMVLGSAGTATTSCTDPKVYNKAIVQNEIIYNGTSTFAASGLPGYEKGVCDMQMLNNLFYTRYKTLQFPTGGSNGPYVITGNTFAGPLPTGSAAGTPIAFTKAGFPSNNYLDGTWPTTGKIIAYRTNAYESGRGRLTLINFDHDATYPVDIDQMGGTPNEHWKLYNLEDPNYYEGTPVATGTCGVSSCGTVTVSTTAATRFQPYGYRLDGTTPFAKVPTQGPEFNVWLLYPDYSFGAPTPTPSPTNTNTPTNTSTRTFSPTATLTSTATSTPSQTPTKTNTPAQSPTASATATPTFSPTQTFTPSRTPTVTPTAAAVASNLIVIEPERDCTLSAPMVKVNDATTFAGGYASSPTQYNGKITCSIPTLAASYIMWARVKSDTPSTSLGDSFNLDVDGDASPTCVTDGNTTCTHIFDVAESQTSILDDQGNATCNEDPIHRDVWFWNIWNDRSLTLGACTGIGTHRTFTLTASTHTFTIRQRDPNAKIDRIILTTDPNYFPSDAALTPTPTPGPRVCKVKCNHLTCYVTTNQPCNTYLPVPCPCR